MTWLNFRNFKELGKTETLALFLISIGSLFILFWLLSYCQYGIDFTDEGFYLSWVSHPFIYSASVTQFGFVYHPLSIIFNGNIAALRQANIILTFALSWTASSLVLKFTAVKITKLQRALISCGLAASSLIFFSNWLTTPNYNSLTIQSLLMGVVGLILTQSGGLTGWVLLGFSGSVCFMAKPTSAAALAFLVIAYIIFLPKFRIRNLFVAAGSSTGFLLVGALIIDGSPTRFIHRLQLGAAHARMLWAGYSISEILRIDRFHLDQKTSFVLFLVGALSLLTTGLCCMIKRSLRYLGISIAILLYGASASLAFFFPYHTIELGDFRCLLLWTIPISAVGLAILLLRNRILSTISYQHLAVAFIISCFPYVYVFGSGNNYWLAASAAGFFPFLAGFIFLGPFVRKADSWQVLAPPILISLGVTYILLQAAVEAPYRQPHSLRLNHKTISIRKSQSTLILSDVWGAYLEAATTASHAAGLKPHTPIIDLTGNSPGLLYAIEAKPIGQPWLLGGYPGSLKVAEDSLRLVPCSEAVDAWLLREPGGPGEIPLDIMPTIGADFAKDYEEVARWPVADGVKLRYQVLLKPRRDVTLAAKACEAARSI